MWMQIARTCREHARNSRECSRNSPFDAKIGPHLKGRGTFVSTRLPLVTIPAIRVTSGYASGRQSLTWRLFGGRQNVVTDWLGRSTKRLSPTGT